MPEPLDPFRHGSLTDVAGVLVGHHHRTGRGWRTGTTVVLAPDGAVAAVDVRGGGPGTRETDALDPRNLVDRIHAVCLTGGSAYGLAAADGVMAHLEQRGLGVSVGPGSDQIVPVVPTAVIFDLGRGGAFGHRPDPSFGERAARASRRRARRGAVGAGTGARAGGLRGGIGMASCRVDLDGTLVHVGALAVVNASGTAIDPARALPWHPVAGLRRPPAPEREELRRVLESAQASPPLNTTIGVVACDADLTRAETGRLALCAHDGLARAIRPAHSLMDGDTVFGLATGRRALPERSAGLLRTAASRAALLLQLHAAAADVFAIACADAVLTAAGGGPFPAYREVCPGAFPRTASTPT